jgi:multidrug efflux pump subunit AcrA (membrane-fusion protein)
MFSIKTIALMFTCAALSLTGTAGVACGQETVTVKDAILKIIESRDIPSKSSGVILRSDIQEGTLVTVGQQLMEIDDQMAQLNLQKLIKEQNIAAEEAATTVELEFMKRSINVAQAELSRALESNQRLPGAVPKSEIEQLALLAERAVAEKDKTIFDMGIKTRQAAIREVEVQIGKQQLADHKIVSPLAGKVVELYKRQGEWVDASQPVARIVQLNKLKTEIKVPASTALNNLKGTKAVFTPKLKSLDGQTFAGKVIFIAPEANPVNSTIRVWVEIENTDLKLVPGLLGTIELGD